MWGTLLISTAKKRRTKQNERISIDGQAPHSWVNYRNTCDKFARKF